MTIRKIHITGGPGSGKTTLARRIAASLDLPHFELDGLALRLDAEGRPFAEMAAETQRIARLGGWVSEGAYLGLAGPLLREADLIIWVDIPWRVASYRIVWRHIRAELARNNRFPGWRRLYRFWRWSGRYYGNQNSGGLDGYGVPTTRDTVRQILEPHRDKLVVCKSNGEITTMLRKRIGV